jgi:hypothetical protein
VSWSFLKLKNRDRTTIVKPIESENEEKRLNAFITKMNQKNYLSIIEQ